MYAIIYIVDGEIVAGYGPYDSEADAAEAFDTIREDPPAANENARTISLEGRA